VSNSPATSNATHAWPGNVFTHSVDLRSNIVRVGLNYKFGAAAFAAAVRKSDVMEEIGQ
jgi:outer membrane immunogenic protein